MIYDISPRITSDLAVWPGDSPPAREVLLDLARGDAVTLSTLRATVHLGAHADAPSHYDKSGETIDERPLDLYIGPCQLIAVDAQPGKTISRRDIKAPITQPRLLIRTGTHPDPEHFCEDFAALDPALVEAMHEQGVRTIGVDTPSVDLFSSKDLPAHRAFARCDMAILEGLVLKDAPEGVYELIALPLALAGFDASPVRAILRTLLKA